MTIIYRAPGVIACSFTDETVKIELAGKRPVYFDFSERFGPLFLDSRGRELRNQPGPRTWAWECFEMWHRAYLERRRSPPSPPSQETRK